MCKSDNSFTNLLLTPCTMQMFINNMVVTSFVDQILRYNDWHASYKLVRFASVFSSISISDYSPIFVATTTGQHPHFFQRFQACFQVLLQAHPQWKKPLVLHECEPYHLGFVSSGFVVAHSSLAWARPNVLGLFPCAHPHPLILPLHVYLFMCLLPIFYQSHM